MTEFRPLSFIVAFLVANLTPNLDKFRIVWREKSRRDYFFLLKVFPLSFSKMITVLTS